MENIEKAICGRILRGEKPEDFENLSDNSERRVVFFLSGEEVEKLRELSDYDKLKTIGWSDQEIKKYLKEGKNFKLLTFPFDTEIAKPATWDNLLDAVARAYPELAKKITAQAEALKKIPYSEIIKRAGYDLAEIEKGDPRFMDVESYAKSKGGLVETRSFLYHTLNINKQFSGEGFTQTEEGKKGMPEFIGLDRKVSDIPDSNIANLDVHLPEHLQELRREIKMR